MSVISGIVDGLKKVGRITKETGSARIGSEADAVKGTSIGDQARVFEGDVRPQAVDRNISFSSDEAIQELNYEHYISNAMQDELKKTMSDVYIKMKEYDSVMPTILSNKFDFNPVEATQINKLFEERRMLRDEYKSLQEQIKAGAVDPTDLEVEASLNYYPDAIREKQYKTINQINQIVSSHLHSKYSEAYRNSLFAEAGDFVHKDYYNKVMTDLEKTKKKTSDLDRAAAKLHDAVVMGKLEFNGRMGISNKENAFQMIEKMPNNFRGLVDALSAKMEVDGAHMSASIAKKLANLTEVSPHVNKYFHQMFGLAEQNLRKIGDQRSMAIRSYVMKADQTKMVKEGNLEFDKDLVAEINRAYNLEMSAEDIALANRISHLNELQRKMFDEFRQGNYAVDMNKMHLEDFDGDTFSGNNYWHAEANEEFLTRMSRAGNQNLSEAIRQFDAGDYAPSTSIYKTVRENSKLRQFIKEEELDQMIMDSNRLTPADELKKYKTKSSKAITTRNEKRLLEEIELAYTVADSIKHGDNLHIKDAYRDAMTRIRKVWESENSMMRETGAVESAVVAATDSMVSLILTKPQLAILNLLDPLYTAANFKGAWNVIKGYSVAGRFGLKGLAQILTDKKIDAAKLWKEASYKDVRHGELMRRFIGENPYVSMVHLDEMEATTFSEKAKAGYNKLRDVATFGFSLTDLIAKGTVFKAAAYLADEVYPQFMKINSEKGLAEAQKYLIKEAHLAEFTPRVAEELINAAFKGKDEFTYQYAKYSTKYEISDLGQYSRSTIHAIAREKGGIASLALRFTSYPMHYYNNIMKGMLRAYKTGDKAPLARFVATNVLLTVGASMMINSEDKRMRSAAEFMQNHVPMTDSGLGMFALPYRSIGGLALAVPSEIIHTTAHLYDTVNNAVEYGMGTSKTDPFTYAGKTFSHIVLDTKQKYSFNMGKSLSFFLRDVESKRLVKGMQRTIGSSVEFYGNIAGIEADYKEMLESAMDWKDDNY